MTGPVDLSKLINVVKNEVVKNTVYDKLVAKVNNFDTTPEFNKLTAENVAARLAQANLITKTDFDANFWSLNRKITLNKTRHLLIENELKNLKIFDLSYIIEKSYFDEDVAQNYLVFQQILQRLTLSILHYKKEVKSIEVVPKTDNTLTPSVNYYGDKVRLRFTGSILQQKTVTHSHKEVVNLYGVYEITNFHGIDNYI